MTYKNIFFSSLATALIVQGCSGMNVDAARNSWIGQSIDAAILRWGEPNGRVPLENHSGQVYVFSRSVSHAATDITGLCQQWGMNADISSAFCQSPERTENCKIHALVQPQGTIAQVIVVEGEVTPFSLCQQMLSTPPI